MSREFQNTISHHPEFCWQALAPAAGISLNLWLSTLSHLKHLYGSQVFCGTFLSVSSTRSWALEPLSFCGCILGSEHKVWDAEIHTVYEIKEWINSELYCVGAVGGLQRRHVSRAPPRVRPTHVLSFLPPYHVKNQSHEGRWCQTHENTNLRGKDRALAGRRTHMWMAVYLISVLVFKLGVEFMRLNLSVADSQHIHTSQDIYEVRTFF